MTIRIGDEAPDFNIDTTHGEINFHEWIGNSYAMIFSHPKDFTPVCTTELGALAKMKPDFDKRNVKVMGLSVDPVDDHVKWIDDITDVCGMKPEYPIVADEKLEVAKLYNMLEGDAGTTSMGRTAVDNETVRTVYVIRPDKRIGLFLTYPMTTGRNFNEILRTIEVIGWTMVTFGVFLYLADRYGNQERTEFSLNPRHIIVLGLWQSLALIPGTSRAGATITAGLLLGYKRRSAVRISMLMAIPTIFASGVYESYEIWQTKNTIPINDVALVTVLTFIFALLALSVMMRLLNKINFTPYVIYRILLGLLLLGLAYN